MHLSRTLASLALSSLATSHALATPAPLPAYGADPKQTSVSGLSSGAFMAVQLQVAYSASIVGAGVVAGGPYYCAANNVLYASICMGQVPFMPPNPVLMATAAKDFAKASLIDPLSHLRQRRVYVFSGTDDSIVRQPAVDATVSFFQQVGVKGEQLQYVNQMPAGHAVITPSYGNDCAANAAPYISHCSIDHNGYDQAQALLQHIYGPLQPRVATPAGQIVSFNQRPYASAATGMADTGYNHWADSNKLLVLYPQVNKSLVPSNPQGCWDWWGYTGANYAYKSGTQMKAIKAMVNRLTQPQ